MTPAEALLIADEIEASDRYWLRFARDACAVTAAREYERGLADGYVRAIADVKAVQRGLVLDAELEARRWGPGGRGHFGDPRPGDFPGRGRREPELEA